MQTTKYRQAGLTLIEMLVAMAISLVVVLAMVSVMANTLGTGTATIEMTRLTQELRTALQLMSRDVRRANYHGNYYFCFANVNCRTDDQLEADAQDYIKMVQPLVTADGPCFWYWLDRDSDGTVRNDSLAGFRRKVANGVGTIQMWTPDPGETISSAPDCDAAAGHPNWQMITDPAIVDITRLVVDTAAVGDISAVVGSLPLSYDDSIAGGATQSIGKIRLELGGVLVRDEAIARTVEDVIRIRNDIYAAAP